MKHKLQVVVLGLILTLSIALFGNLPPSTMNEAGLEEEEVGLGSSLFSAGSITYLKYSNGTISGSRQDTSCDCGRQQCVIANITTPNMTNPVQCWLEIYLVLPFLNKTNITRVSITFNYTGSSTITMCRLTRTSPWDIFVTWVRGSHFVANDGELSWMPEELDVEQIQSMTNTTLGVFIYFDSSTPPANGDHIKYEIHFYTNTPEPVSLLGIPQLTILSVYGLLIAVSFPLGFAVMDVLVPSWISKRDGAMSFILATAVGLSLIAVLWWLLSVVIFEPFTLILLPFITGLIVIGLTLHGRLRGRIPEPDTDWRTRGGFMSPQNAVFAAMLLLSIYHFILTTSYLSWSQIGDPWFHGRYVLTIIDQGRLPTDFCPYDSSPLGYPLGYHVLVASSCSILSIVPGVGMIAVAGFLMVLLTLIPPSLVFRRTRSITYSCLAYVLCFYVHESMFAQSSIYLNFLNGTYPVLLGIVTSLLVIAFWMPNGESQSSIRSVLVLTLLLSAAIYLVYPFFLIIPGFFLLFWASSCMRSRIQGIRTGCFRERVTTRKFGVIVLIFFACFVLTYSHIEWLTGQIISRLLTVLSHNYYINDTYFIQGFYAPINLIAVGGAAVQIKRGSGRVAPTVFLILFGAAILSMIPSFYMCGLGFILPSRLMMLLQLWSYALLFNPIHMIEKRIEQSLPRGLVAIRSIPHWYQQIVCAMLVFIVVGSSLFSLATLDLQSDAAWFTRSSVFEDDLAGAYFIANNLEYGSLVLNYETQSDWTLPSVGIPNVVFSLPINQNNLDRAHDLERVWINPANETLVRTLLRQYGIGVVYVSSFWAVRRLIDNWNGTFVPRPVPASLCYLYFRRYFFLEEVFHQGDCSVFIVDCGVLAKSSD